MFLFFPSDPMSMSPVAALPAAIEHPVAALAAVEEASGAGSSALSSAP